MNMKPIEEAKDRDLANSVHAMKRAAQRARQVAAQTGTALIVYRDGQIERVTITDLDSMAVDTGINDLAEGHDHYLYGTQKR